MSYKAAIIAVGESTPSYNGLRFATSDEANAYGKNLFSRWMGMKSFTVEESSDPVNYQFVDGKLITL